jgi:hypothetical protein
MCRVFHAREARQSAKKSYREHIIQGQELESKNVAKLGCLGLAPILSILILTAKSSTSSARMTFPPDKPPFCYWTKPQQVACSLADPFDAIERCLRELTRLKVGDPSRQALCRMWVRTLSEGGLRYYFRKADCNRCQIRRSKLTSSGSNARRL